MEFTIKNREVAYFTKRPKTAITTIIIPSITNKVNKNVRLCRSAPLLRLTG